MQPLVMVLAACLWMVPTVYAEVLWHRPSCAPHPLRTYEDTFSIGRVASLVDVETFRAKHLKPLLVPRPVGSRNHAKVEKYLKSHFTNLGWHVMEDVFTADTPSDGKMIPRQFRNIVATLNPYAPRRLVLAAHYDSKLFDDFDFVGATDSAVPCAMMIHMATVLDPYLQNRNTMKDVTLQFIFFDGEEAFEEWTHTDSIYGARHLAQTFETNTVLRPGSLGGMGGDYSSADRDRRDADEDGAMPSLLQAMDVMVLLDLLGAKNPKLYALQQPTEALHQRLHEIERNLGILNLLEDYRSWNGYFQPLNPRINYAIEDDHLPFLHRNVPVVHVIATPFPPVWHKESDNANAIDYPTTMNLLKVFTVFVCEYMHLDIPYP
eukprot:comp20599_c1_seq3/m.26548 comp20599_c1_seq3/g.26548  ORF comp20599_c1_seq3/g.26548 comp20599_c1_seq3/m.26548 type:complete len:377 (-) comp20599_c1_seq3:325-1455(-)